MKEKPVKLPGPDHPISIERNPAQVVVSVGGHVVADTRNALIEACRAVPWTNRASLHNVHVLINCTPVGMHPNVDDTPMSQAAGTARA